MAGSPGMYDNEIRVTPPLVITKTEVGESPAIMQNVLMNLKL